MGPINGFSIVVRSPAENNNLHEALRSKDIITASCALKFVRSEQLYKLLA